MEQNQKCEKCGLNHWVPEWDKNIEIPLLMYHYKGMYLCQTCRIKEGLDHALARHVKQGVQKRKRKMGSKAGVQIKSKRKEGR